MASAPAATAPAAGRSWFESPEAFEAWLEQAAPGDSFVYAHAFTLGGVKLPIVAAAQAAYDEGAVRLHQRANRPGFDYVAVRRESANAPRVKLAAPAKGRTASAIRLNADAISLLAAVDRAAKRREVCPSDTNLARQAGLRDRKHASFLIQKLEDAGELARRKDKFGNRVITILETNRSTASADAEGA